MANQRDRQKRNAKKRARREKRLTKKVAYLRRSASPPLRMLALPKMSEDLVEFAAPILDALDGSAGAAEWRNVLLLAATVWNMTCAIQRCLDEAGEAAADTIRLDLFAGLVEATGWSRDECERIVTQLEERKRTLFADDPRRVVDVRTVDTEEGVHVFALSSF